VVKGWTDVHAGLLKAGPSTAFGLRPHFVQDDNHQEMSFIYSQFDACAERC